MRYNKVIVIVIVGRYNNLLCIYPCLSQHARIFYLLNKFGRICDTKIYVRFIGYFISGSKSLNVLQTGNIWIQKR